MVSKNLLIAAVLTLQFMPGICLAGDDPLEPADQEKTGQYYIYNADTETFSAVPQTEEGVDSLLTLSAELHDKNSRLSFISAREALLLSESISYTDGRARALNMVANKYLDFGDYEHALQHYLQAMELENELGNRERAAALMNNIALVHLEQKNYERAADFLSSSITLHGEIGLGDQVYLMLNNLGVIQRRQGNYDEALSHFRESQQQALDVASDTLVHMVATLNIGNTLRNMGELDEAIGYLLKANQYFDRNELTLHQITSYLFLGQLYLDRRETETAIEYAAKSLELSTGENQRERIKDAHELLASIHELEGDMQRAYEHFTLYHQYSDTLYNIQKSNLLQEMQTRFDVEQKNRDLELLSKEFALQEASIAQQDQIRKSLIAGIVLLFVIASLLIYMNRQKKRGNKLLKKRREEIARQNAKLADLNKEKDEFLSIIAHDLRNPVTVVKTAVELIETEENPTQKNLEEYTDLIHISTDRMMNLLNNLLDVQSMGHTKSRSLRMQKLDVDDLLEESLTHYRRSASAKEITINRHSEGEEAVIMGDEGIFVRIMDNLISNAIKYSPMGSDVSIHRKTFEDRIRISVIDQGPGISAEEREKLFGKFSKLSSKPTGNEKSTGLGLYIVKKLVRSMDGFVGCISKEGEGSEFYVEFSVAGTGDPENLNVPAGNLNENVT
ncbi:ATP-binding protein [Rhodohalobacter mucosus]|nr:ATP-binding protein [Rhodohalobacter mucosus]